MNRDKIGTQTCYIHQCTKRYVDVHSMSVSQSCPCSFLCNPYIHFKFPKFFIYLYINFNDIYSQGGYMSIDRKQQQQLQQQQPIQWCNLKALYTKLPSAFNMHVYSVCSKNKNLSLEFNIENSGKYGIATENKSSLRNE